MPEKFLKYKARILAVTAGDQPDRLKHDIHVSAFRGYTANTVIPAGTLLSEIIEREFNSIPPTYTITAVAGSNGSISPSGAVSVTAGESKTFTITANSGYVIRDVKVDSASVGAVATYTFNNVSANHSIMAEFEAAAPTTYTVSPFAGAHGAISPNTPQTVNEGGSVMFTAVPDSGYRVKDWKLDGTSQGSTNITFSVSNVTANHTVAVEFEEIPATTYTVTSSAGANGSVSPLGAQTVIEHNSITFTATPASGYVVDAWKLDSATQSETGTSFTVSNVTTDHTVEVTFKTAPVVTHTITATAGANGSISPSGTVTVNDGASQTFTMTPNSGYQIKDVKVDGASIGTASSYPFTNVTADHTISVEFEAIPITTYTVTPSAGANGTISPNTAQTVNAGGSVTFTATPASGYKVKDWKLDGTAQGSTNATFTVSNVTADHTVAVEFEAVPSGNIYNQAYTPGNGRVWQEPTAAIIVPGTPVADPAAAVAQIKGAGYSWTSKAQSKSIETFLIAKSLARVTSIISPIGSEMLNNGFSEKTITLDGVDYWCYYASETVGAGNSTYTLKGV